MAVRLSFASDRNPASRGVDKQNALVGRRVLVVDDSVSQRHRLSEIYLSLGMQVVGEAAHGLECLALVDRLQPDIISLDVIMPVMHGVETLGYLRESKSQAVIIYVSALGGVDAITELKAPGGHLPDAVFSKKIVVKPSLRFSRPSSLGKTSHLRSLLNWQSKARPIQPTALAEPHQ